MHSKLFGGKMVSRREFLGESGVFLALSLIDPKEALGVLDQQKGIDALKENLAKPDEYIDQFAGEGIELNYFNLLESLVGDFNRLARECKIAKEARELLDKYDYNGLEKKIRELKHYFIGADFSLKNLSNSREELSDSLKQLGGDLRIYDGCLNHLKNAFELAKDIAAKKDPDARIYWTTENILHQISYLLTNTQLDKYVDVNQDYSNLLRLKLHKDIYFKLESARIAFNKINFLRIIMPARIVSNALVYELDKNKVKRIKKYKLDYKIFRAQICLQNITAIRDKAYEYGKKTNGFIPDYSGYDNSPTGVEPLIHENRVYHYNNIMFPGAIKVYSEQEVEQIKKAAELYRKNLEKESLDIMHH